MTLDHKDAPHNMKEWMVFGRIMKLMNSGLYRGGDVFIAMKADSPEHAIEQVNLLIPNFDADRVVPLSDVAISIAETTG